jgi:hypothetical protein
MTTLHNDTLVKVVEPVQDNVALLSVGGGLEYYQSFWLVLPDGRVILWRDSGGNLLGRMIDGAERKTCAEPRSGDKPCVGLMFATDGTPVPN